jgi:hypothetical protein
MRSAEKSLKQKWRGHDSSGRSLSSKPQYKGWGSGEEREMILITKKKLCLNGRRKPQILNFLTLRRMQ